MIIDIFSITGFLVALVVLYLVLTDKKKWYADKPFWICKECWVRYDKEKNVDDCRMCGRKLWKDEL